MAYADTIRVANPTISNIATLIDGLRVTYGSAVGTTIMNTTSTSYVDMTAMSFSLTVPSGGIALLHADVQFSSSAASYVSFQIVEDGTLIGVTDQTQYGSSSSSSGYSNSISISVLRTAASVGAHTYKLQWKVPTTTTGYSLRQNFWGVVFQNT